jgi:hypothetical protein
MPQVGLQRRRLVVSEHMGTIIVTSVLARAARSRRAVDRSIEILQRSLPSAQVASSGGSKRAPPEEESPRIEQQQHIEQPHAKERPLHAKRSGQNGAHVEPPPPPPPRASEKWRK